ncbi:thiol-disulfide oxidoreductase DCC family protein [Cyanobium sp. NS01]|uniref:thiol-disulfide oxidoreductase DCC family protein n=1 Tax=Cyanobium sp. NS01 TaxID=261284 RepID=UPI001646503F|nr:DUF393 domain-containing protein [Cyanobium sp. NS01]QNI70743.1 hypothetical protein CyaNS01_01611 [Cyanobium sp. NS01]
MRILYDGGCPLCLREVRLLRARDQQRHGDQPVLAFIDIDAAGYDPSAHAGITYRDAMGTIHGISGDGELLSGVEVFRRAYGLVGLGWIYAPTRWPLVQPLVESLYQLWARWRLRLTGRPGLEELCRNRCAVSSVAEPALGGVRTTAAAEPPPAAPRA